MARPRRFDEEALLDAATELFWSRGYDGTSLEDVAAATGVGNGSIYAAYGSKRGLFLALFERYCDRRAAFVEQVLGAAGGSGHEAARAFFEAIIDDCAAQPDRRGCLMVTTMAQAAPRDPGVVAAGRRATERMERSLALRLVDAVDETEAALLSAHLVLVSQGLIQLSRDGASRDRLRELAAVSVASVPQRVA